MKLGKAFRHRRTGYLVKIIKIEVSFGMKEPLFENNQWIFPNEVVYNIDLTLQIIGIGGKFVKLYERVRTVTKPYDENEITPLIEELLKVKLDSADDECHP